jgi:hypothetical protein
VKPEKQGSFVRLGTTLIPALNIQTEGVPGYLSKADGSKVWYGLYFEVSFPVGALWIVEQGFRLINETEWEKRILVTEHPKWGLSQSLDFPGVTRYLEDWEEFLGLYIEKRFSSGQTC